MDKVPVQLGFVQECDLWLLNSKFFPSKVGGKPSWLALRKLPGNTELSCKLCSKQMVFMLQVYAPIQDNDKAFHRTLFVFLCRDPNCSSPNDASNMRVFCSQLPKENEFYDAQPPKEEEEGSEHPSAVDYVSLCRVCGCLGDKRCIACKKAKYCSAQHQAVDWKAGHNLECKAPDKISLSTSKGEKQILFSEYELDIDSDCEEKEHEKSEEEVMKEYEELIRQGQVKECGSDSKVEDDLAKMAVRETDKEFAKFRTVMSREPEQVLRYERGADPLPVAAEHSVTAKMLPPCTRCGKPMTFEFQIMPQLLVHLKLDSLGKSVDWGTIFVFTCQDSCQPEGVNYVEEVVRKQDYSAVDALARARQKQS